MPSSTRTPISKFLIDENVRRELYKFLKQKGVDVKLTTKGCSDQTLSDISKSEKRIIVTNDEDFSKYSQDQVRAVIWLKIPQNEEATLLKSFDKLLAAKKDFAGKLIILHDERWEESLLEK